MTEQSKKLRVAKIVSVHGVRGILKVQVFLENPNDLTQLGPLTNRDGTKTYDVTIKGQGKGTLLCALKGITDRTAAENMRGTELFVERGALPEVEDDEQFYVTDLVGMDVVDDEDIETTVGRVRAVQDHGAGDIIVINYKEAGRRDEMFSFTYEIFPEVNLAERWISFVRPGEVSERDEGEGAEDTEK